MRKLALAAAVVAAISAPAPGATAHPDYDVAGRCEFVITDTEFRPIGGTSGTYTLAMSLLVIATTSGDPATPVVAPISMQCDLYLNGILVGTPLSASGITVAADAATMKMSFGPDDIITTCTTGLVNGEPHTNCHDIPPVGPADTVLCATTKGLPDFAPWVTFDSEGDVYQHDRLVFDCPPYGG